MSGSNRSGAVPGFKLAIARAAGRLSRVSGRGGGTSLPGKILLRLQPDAIERLVRRLPAGSVMISATNGKTTTASLLAGILRQAGYEPAHNRAGANMAGGVAGALLDAGRGGAPPPDIGLFEVDEAWLPDLARRVRPSTVLLCNLFRDQLDRYGELEALADSWARTIAGLPPEVTVVLNADDPLIAQLAGDRPNVLYFGVDDRSCAEPRPRHAADSKFCRRCERPLVYDAVQLGHLGHYHCDGCGLTRPAPRVTVESVELHGMDGSGVTIATPDGPISVELPIPGLYNVYNAVAAAAAAHAIGIAPAVTAAGLEAARAVFGRVEKVSVRGKDVSLLLIKNPTGANEVLRTIAAGGEFNLWAALNDKTADGHDISWIWDADFEDLAGRVRHVTCSGTRAPELALRLVYAGVDRGAIVVDDGIERSFDSAVARAGEDDTPLYALPTYTSLLELRAAIAKRGHAPSHWR